MRGLAVILVLVLVSAGGPGWADEWVEEFDGAPNCPDGSILGPQLMTDICWDCIFPIMLGGAMIGGGDIPSRAADQSVCLCTDGLGLPSVGIAMGMWEPARLIEVVRAPGCSPSLGGIILPGVNRLQQGTRGGDDYDTGDISFYHYHYYAFPILIMLELFVEDRCIGGGMVDFDLLYMSELDPTWNYDELAFFLNPEAALFANPAAMMACLADAGAAAAGEPLDELFWCAGAWGPIYPLVGSHVIHHSAPQTSSLLSVRALAALHRRGLAWRTMGRDTMCEARLDPFLPKSQYRMSMTFPIAEANSNHVIGLNTFLWGEHRQLPGVGEDFVYLLWRWNDCCLGTR